jgi:hypothetical protein
VADVASSRRFYKLFAKRRQPCAGRSSRRPDVTMRWSGDIWKEAEVDLRALEAGAVRPTAATRQMVE